MNIQNEYEVEVKKELIVNEVNELNQQFSVFNEVKEFGIVFDDINKEYVLQIVFSQDLFNLGAELLYVRFLNISNLILKDFNGKFSQLMDIVVERDLNGWEGCHYKVHQLEDDKLFFYCQKIEMKNCA